MRGLAVIETMVSDAWMARLRWVVAAVFVGVFAFFAGMSWRWNVTGDTAEMHYIVFLIRHGRTPYAQITDMNMPGTYLCEWLAMAVFGWGDVAWRCYEFFLMLVLTASGVVIAGRRRWMGGVLAGAFFIALHAADGPPFAVERDEMLTIFTAVAFAALATAVRRRLPSAAVVFGLAVGLAISIKPTGLLLDVALLGVAMTAVVRRGERIRRYLLWGIAGQMFVGVLVLAWMVHYRAVGPFVFILRKVLPMYAATNRLGLRELLKESLPSGLLLPFLLAGGVAVMRRGRMEWEEWATLLCAGVGVLSFVVQGKGYNYHRYEFAYFIALWIGMELNEALRVARVGLRVTGVVGVLVFLVALPHYVRVVLRDRRGVYRSGPEGLAHIGTAVMQDRDLESIGGNSLQGRVVCLDSLNGCLNGLYRLRMLENTSYTGDMLLFAPVETPLVRHYRDEFLGLQERDPAEVVVLGKEWYVPSNNAYERVDMWPAYKRYLEANYTEVVERRGSELPGSLGYKLLLRNGSAALARAEANPLGMKPVGGLDAP
ncbi:MAG: hypothetical protein HIU91_16705 [Acidobacteria bacterium]|nr:hypothetical protein [Acidobacteriota bacterium]